MTKTTRSLLGVLFFALGLLAFFLAASGGYGIASPDILGIAGLILMVVCAGLVGMTARRRL